MAKELALKHLLQSTFTYWLIRGIFLRFVSSIFCLLALPLLVLGWWVWQVPTPVALRLLLTATMFSQWVSGLSDWGHRGSLSQSTYQVHTTDTGLPPLIRSEYSLTHPLSPISALTPNH